MSVTFTSAGGSRYAEIAQFIHANWAENHVYTRSRELFEWTFRNGFGSFGDGYSIMLAQDGGEIVGMLGGIPFDFNSRGANHKAIWIVNYVVREDHRRGATGLKLLGTLRGDPYAVTIAFGINPATATVYKVLRGEVLPAIPRYMFALPGRSGRLSDLIRTVNADWPEERAAALASAFELGQMPATSEPIGRQLPSDWDARSWSRFACDLVGAARHARYLQWRYVDHPAFQYRIITIPDEDRDGLLIWRLENITHEGATVERIGRIVELLPASHENCRQLMSALASELRAEDAVGADYYGYHGPSGEWLQDLGIRRTSVHPQGESLPARFQPLSNREGNIMAAQFRCSAIPAVELGPSCPWYWTKSDSDQDRPR